MTDVSAAAARLGVAHEEHQAADLLAEQAHAALVESARDLATAVYVNGDMRVALNMLHTVYWQVYELTTAEVAVAFGLSGGPSFAAGPLLSRIPCGRCGEWLTFFSRTHRTTVERAASGTPLGRHEWPEKREAILRCGQCRRSPDQGHRFDVDAGKRRSTMAEMWVRIEQHARRDT